MATSTSSDWALGQDELAFLKSETGFEDETELKQHLVDIQRKALAIYDYPCIRRFGFAKLKISKSKSAYEHVLRLVRNNPKAILLDIGCCFGNDLRKIASDGFPAEHMVANDLRGEFWDLGHELFKSTPQSFPVTFLAGDIFDDDFLRLAPPLTPEPTDLAAPLPSISSLNDLRGRVSVVHSASLFHLFAEAKQLELARKLAGLLSTSHGSIIFGCHAALPTKGFTEASKGKYIFCHSPETWRAMWEDEVFDKGSVEVRTTLRYVGKVLNENTDFYMMFWSVKRIL
ncbi:hypothetical protein HMN09_00425600 [Mycena chlorophos]|uniref:Methyltransferase domain-containing protein n=1 Tax=Mycena chlorophos TaxID=658473 RepID=A0A8H6TJL6_MYCCL|nr:hypothetical protein HMN09_00425600 [Mycena chlorophos]